MHERAVTEPQCKVANALRRFYAQFLEHLADQARVLVCHFGFCLVAYEGAFHAQAPLRWSSVIAATACRPLMVRPYFIFTAGRLRIEDVWDWPKDSAEKRFFHESFFHRN